MGTKALLHLSKSVLPSVPVWIVKVRTPLLRVPAKVISTWLVKVPQPTPTALVMVMPAPKEKSLG